MVAGIRIAANSIRAQGYTHCFAEEVYQVQELGHTSYDGSCLAEADKHIHLVCMMICRCILIVCSVFL